MNSREAEMSDYPALLESVSQLAEAIQDLNRRAVLEYTPVVETILRTRSRDTRHIEHTLDGLLGFCGYEPALLLYRKLCRYYFVLEPAAAVDYVNSYREMWEDEDV
jgi:hypothetical protein